MPPTAVSRGCAATAVPAGSTIEARENAPEISVLVRSVALGVATACGVGRAPVAPGTFGSAVGLVLYLPLAALGLPLYALTVVALLFLGIWAADVAERVYGVKDDGRIVIDEVVGQLITLAPLLVLAPGPQSLLGLVTGFVVFRLFDT